MKITKSMVYEKTVIFWEEKGNTKYKCYWYWKDDRDFTDEEILRFFIDEVWQDCEDAGLVCVVTDKEITIKRPGVKLNVVDGLNCKDEIIVIKDWRIEK